MATLRSWGLEPEVGPHALDRDAYRAGTDEDRLADVDAALRDPGLRAVFATRGGKGAYRIADRIDLAAARENRTLLVGCSDITVLLLRAVGADLPSVHGPMLGVDVDLGAPAVERLRRALMTDDPVVVPSDRAEATAALTNGGRAVTGTLIGGNQDSIATAAGWALPNLDGAILLLEGFNQRLGHLDRQLTMLRNAGHLDGIAGVAVGQYVACGPERDEPPAWSPLDVLRHHLDRWAVPVLGGLPIGHGVDVHTVPLGTTATLDPTGGTLTLEPATG